MSERQEDKITIVLCGHEYLIAPRFTLSDMELYLKNMEDGETAKTALVSIIYRKLQNCEVPIPTHEEVLLEEDSVFEPYILSIIESSEKWKVIYEQTDISLSVIERFSLSIKQFSNECSKNIMKAMQPTISMIEQMNRNINLSWINDVQRIVNLYQPAINDAILQVAKVAQRTAEILAPIQKVIQQYTNSFANIISNIQIPTYSEEQKKILIESYKTWGSMGWSVIPHAPLKLFNSVPDTIKEADKIALQYFDKDGMEHLFSNLKKKRIKKEDINSAIYCFENKQYKACALLLFGIIDAKLIRLQSIRKTEKRRKVGGKAVKELETKYREKMDEEYFLYHMLYATGLLSCLNTFFADGNDFRQEPDVINRNFIDHGMNRRRVRKKDCIQLFVALYDLVEFLEDL